MYRRTQGGDIPHRMCSLLPLYLAANPQQAGIKASRKVTSHDIECEKIRFNVMDSMLPSVRLLCLPVSGC